MITRRLFVTGAAVAPLLSVDGQGGEARFPEEFGARSGPLGPVAALANTQALKRAFESGRPIDGRGRSYDISGVLRIDTPPRLKNLALRQRSTDVRLEKTLLMDGLAQEIVLENLVIDMMGLQQVAGMGQCSALQISHCRKASLRNVSIRNGGAITGAKIIDVAEAGVDRFEARDFIARFDREPRDDVCQGIEFQMCPGFRVRRSRITNLTALWPRRPAVFRQYSRGVVCGHGQGGDIDENRIGPGVEQGIDISSSSNRGLRVTRNEVVDAGTWGVKCANRFRDILIEDNTILRPGCAGITCSAPDDAGGEAPGAVTIRGNAIINPGASGLWAASGPAGIILYARADAGPNAPSGVIATGNRIVDDQKTHTMTRGFDAVTAAMGGRGAALAWAARSGSPPNRERDNVVSGFTIERSRGWG